MKKLVNMKAALSTGAMALALGAAAHAQEAAAAAEAPAMNWVKTIAAAALGVAAVGSALGLGRAVAAAMESMGRQPEAAAKIQTAMIIGCAFIEALTIYALVGFLIS